MSEPGRLRVLVLAPYLNGRGLGEVYSIFRWVEALSQKADVTVLAITGDEALAPQLPAAEVVEFKAPRLLSGRLRRFEAMAKPWVPLFFRRARRWIETARREGRVWDVAHQVLPQAMRYASPLAGLGLPYVVGPLGGSLATPEGFRSEVRESGLYARLRGLDRLRLRHDRRLRRGYEDADVVLGVAGYVADILRDTGVAVRRFEPVLERVQDGEMPEVIRSSAVGNLTLLHVGRAVRTKGLRDVIRALARLGAYPGVRLISAGDGPDLTACRAEAATLGIADRVSFLGQVSRDRVNELYAEADVFCFPSFREPMGGVFFEAMQWGLPIIAADRGGPAFILDDRCAILLPVMSPDQLVDDLAAAIRRLADNPGLRQAMGAAARDRLTGFGTWSDRADALIDLYREAIRARAARAV